MPIVETHTLVLECDNYIYHREEYSKITELDIRDHVVSIDTKEQWLHNIKMIEKKTGWRVIDADRDEPYIVCPKCVKRMK